MTLLDLRDLTVGIVVGACVVGAIRLIPPFMQWFLRPRPWPRD